MNGRAKGVAQGEAISQQASGVADRVPVPGIRLGAGQLVRETLKRARRHRIDALASHIAFRLVFALFPGLVAFLWLLQVIHAEGLVSHLLDLVATVMPTVAEEQIQEQLTSGAGRSGGAAWGAPLAFIVAAWSVSSAFRATSHALNEISEIPAREDNAARYVWSFVASLAVFGLLVAAVALAVTGRDIADSVGGGRGFQIAWIGVSWAGVGLMAMVAIALTYHFGPDSDKGFRWVSIGAALATTMWIGYTLLFGIYVNVISRPEETYGALAGVAIVMLYIYASVAIVLYGAELNTLLDESRTTKGAPH